MADAATDMQGSTLSGKVASIKSTSLPINAATYAIFQNIGTMRTHLLANGYTAAQLQVMNKNDLREACRLGLGI